MDRAGVVGLSGRMNKVIPYLISIAAAFGVTLAEDGSVLLHAGPRVESPGLGSVQRGGTVEAEPLVFEYRFSVSKEKLESLPYAGAAELPPLLAVEAIGAARKSIFDPEGDARIFVKELRLLMTSEEVGKSVGYYLVTFLHNGSEAHRAVLMDGSVLEPELVKVESDAE